MHLLNLVMEKKLIIQYNGTAIASRVRLYFMTSSVFY